MPPKGAPPGALVALAWANLALVFAVELAALAAFGVWGAQAVSPTLGRWLLGIVAPLVAAVLWGLFCAPRAAISLPKLAVVSLKLAMLTAAVLALASTGRPDAAAALAVIGGLSALLARLLPDPTPHALSQARVSGTET